MINWKPIEEIPEALKEGCLVLLWAGDEATIAHYVTYAPGCSPNGKEADWHDEGGSLGFLSVTHFAEIKAP